MNKFVCLSLAVMSAPLSLLAAPKAAFTSPIVDKEHPLADIEADLSGAATLALVVDDAGDGYGCDWADWVEPVLVGPQGEVKLTTVKPVQATTGHGEVRVDKNSGGGPMKVMGQPVSGFGVHANSIITFDIAGKGFTKFKAKGGVDNGGTDQGCGSTVRFLVYALKQGEDVPKNAASPNKQGGLTPEETMTGLVVPDGLEVSLFASEPLISNPTDIDVDARGRVWVCEGVNYRKWASNDPAGDRIVILEDTDGDGKADKSTVFYQGKDIDAALGICVLGNKVIVSRSPDVFCFYDDNGDGKADRKEKIFTGIKGQQHDHAMHAFQFGPDGKLYFNFGNAGGELHTPDGKFVVDLAGNEVSDRGKPYRQGMVFRCDENFSNVETLGWNFRNNYEVTVDSFGTMWQSDNDDDGNKGVRINYVMEFGNYGYTDEKTGAGWSSYRIGWEDEIPRRHWHQNDPGVVPNLLVTGAGSPTGITTYEGDLLPAIFRNQIIHCDAGPRATRAYPVTKSGAGYAATTENVLTAKDNWYRPSDVCVMPDGSLLIADWYDPGVGGHNMQDNTPGQTKGRLYRVAPAGHKMSVPKIDLSDAKGAVAALRSPNYATRYLAWKKLQELGAETVAPLMKLAKDDNPRMRARGIWALARAAGKTDDAIKLALGDKDEDVRGMAVRIAREGGANVEGLVKQLVRDSSAQVRRECAIALRFSKSPDAPALWAELAAQYDGKDRWYLEALGIGSDLNATACLDAWLKKIGGKWNTAEGRDIVWRTRGAQAAKLLADIVLDPAVPDAQRPRFVRALHFLESNAERDAALLRLLGSQFAAEAAEKLSFKSAQGREAEINKALESVKGTVQFVNLVEHFKLAGQDAELLNLSLSRKDASAGIAASRHLIANGKLNLLTDALRGEKAAAASLALGLSNDRRVLPALEATATDAASAIRATAATAMAAIESGAKRLLELARENKLPADAKAAALNSISGSLWVELADEAKKLLGAKEPAPLPKNNALAKTSGDAAKGKILFQAICSSCHQVDGVGGTFGPALSEVGTKLGKEALYDALLNPNNGISFGYETWYLTFKSGDSAIGLLASETREEITLKSVSGALTTYDKRQYADKPVKLKTSAMPDVARGLPPESLADLVEYLASLKKK